MLMGAKKHKFTKINNKTWSIRYHFRIGRPEKTSYIRFDMN